MLPTNWFGLNFDIVLYLTIRPKPTSQVVFFNFACNRIPSYLRWRLSYYYYYCYYHYYYQCDAVIVAIVVTIVNICCCYYSYSVVLIWITSVWNFLTRHFSLGHDIVCFFWRVIKDSRCSKNFWNSKFIASY